MSFVMSSEVETSLTLSVRSEEAKTTDQRFLHFVWKAPQNGILPGGFEILQSSPKYWVEEPVCMQHIEIERDELAIEMQFGLIVQRIAVVVVQPFLQRP
jgi:hypothetical protein